MKQKVEVSHRSTYAQQFERGDYVTNPNDPTGDVWVVLSTSPQLQAVCVASSEDDYRGRRCTLLADKFVKFSGTIYVNG